MVATYPSTSNNVDTSAQAAILDDKDSTYSLLYLDTVGIAGPIRNILALAGAQWTQLYPQDWENEDKLDKTSVPFEVLPVLYVHSKDGSQTVAIAECKSIELYLSEKYNLLGRNSYEKTLVRSFVSSSSSLWDDFTSAVANLKASAEVKQEQIVEYMTKKVPNWIRIHEQHLKANGLNGHYVGDTISLADLRAVALIDKILLFPSAANLITPEITPGLLKLKQVIDSDPKIIQWRESELCKSLRLSRAFPQLPRAPGIKLNDRQGNKTGGV
ncbi:hypothetical protein BGX21_005475 [Mortierella sp. AD011]|nr:hypothetical protein BGX20_005348 [Mortierella sp. AD010]KAF9399862.1 hypothetical protein BGX21_005475 [Mortierella sp. AD011]